MIPVADALARIENLMPILPAETVPLRAAAGRVLVQPVTAGRDQPPFPASAMDGYAVRNADVAPGATLEVIGEAAAGAKFPGRVGAGQAVRIFTGAPVPIGADRVVIQEDTHAADGTVTLKDRLDTAMHIRAAAQDFARGTIFAAPKRMTAADIALLAAMNAASVQVARKPMVALISTGDELVQPGESPRDDQIISSNSLGLAALVESAGAEARVLPIARDRADSLIQAFTLSEGADLIVTIGGASVGDHDIVRQVAEQVGMETELHKIAMRPGKPLMAGRIHGTPMIGLPGNPVSAMICGHVFLRPAINAMLGLGGAALARQSAVLTQSLPANGPREHYMRARLGFDGATMTVRAEDRQDSALLSVLAGSDALLVRPPHDAARAVGDTVSVIPL
jgi:molybdopterin molybdotransferase